MHRIKPRTYRPRRGLSVLEVTLSLLVLAVAIGGLAQLITTAAAQRRASETRRLASQEAANVAERIALLAWDELTTERLAAWKPSVELTSTVPSAKLQLDVASEPSPPEAKRVQIDVQWTDASGQTLDPISLTVWKFQPEEGAQ
jgi:Tfp pilus assembly protein PilV